MNGGIGESGEIGPKELRPMHLVCGRCLHHKMSVMSGHRPVRFVHLCGHREVAREGFAKMIGHDDECPDWCPLVSLER